ncbi:carbohydrate ABC transporter permease [Microbacterium trichothecenolyticum]|uniref:L-arabinose transport system permease protein AraQ n=1 Tax=Microbacterium trichothecenolyticum TaxID=69370 RepID=A0A0M2H5R1_MICTR|nr:carbohydrate ABC transporter permease [Microbacterium trichothecenolyticum]KJL41676.1 L-arabinose transport system permease protein AraQ [Microbacterium trichothecenolyticum]
MSTAVKIRLTDTPASDLSTRTIVAPTSQPSAAAKIRGVLTSRAGSVVAILIAVLWTIPTFGLFVESFRSREAQMTEGWWTFSGLTLENYQQLTVGVDGDTSSSLIPFIVNSLVIVVPATIVPVIVAAMTAYALVWMDFKGKDVLFLAIVALQIVPLQMAIVPVLRFIVDGFSIGDFTIIPPTGLAGTIGAVWLAHMCFAIPLAVFLMHNFMSEIPRELLESGMIDGAGHGRIFLKIMLPLIMPAIAAFAIFQFVWVWNDLFVGLIMSGGNEDITPITVKVQNLLGLQSSVGEELIPAAAFLAMIIPFIVFISLQRYFVKGLLVGSVKG